MSVYGIKVFCLHDFDIAGLTIANTLASSNRRYRFENQLDFIDMGLRLQDAEAMGLQSEPFEPDKRVSPEKLRERLRAYGATAAEIDMLVGQSRRVEIDAMADPLAVVAFIERSLVAHGIGKIVPLDEVMAAHFQKTAFDLRLDQAIAPLQAEINARCQDVAAQMQSGDALQIEVPPLREHVRRHLAKNPHETWRDAVAAVARRSELGSAP